MAAEHLHALLRGVNVGGAHVLPTDDFVRILESLNLRQVQLRRATPLGFGGLYDLSIEE